MNIRTWLEQEEHRDWGEGGPDLTAELSQMLGGKMDSTDAATIWRQIATGEASVLETLLWVRHVAQQIKQNVISAKGTSSERDRAALMAIGFYGPVDPYREAKLHMHLISELGPCDADGTPRSRFWFTGKDWLKILRSAGHFTDVDEKTALNRISEWRKEFGIEHKDKP